MCKFCLDGYIHIDSRTFDILALGHIDLLDILTLGHYDYVTK